MKFASLIPNLQGCSAEEKILRLENCLESLLTELDIILENLDETNFSESGLSAVRGNNNAS